ncbi:pilus assembly FimT family protein [Halomonas sp. V046]|uniref:pilus assembly FimT family protein n=1 Tax=Halomonas sp. V046 TaxID=3459611 RepID=UPI004044FB0D
MTAGSAGRSGGDRQRGISLIELLVSLAVMAAVASVAIPNLGAWLDENRLAADVNQVVGALTLARNAAVTRRGPVSLRAEGPPARPYWRLMVSDAGGYSLLSLAASPGDVVRISAGELSFDLLGRLDACSFGAPCQMTVSLAGVGSRDIVVEASGQITVISAAEGVR